MKRERQGIFERDCILRIKGVNTAEGQVTPQIVYETLGC